ncbi:MAG: chemotaxis protein CheD [Deltaproteobacteria bacterium]
MIFVVQGTFAVSNKTDEIIHTLLGSCVATCLYDPVVRVGGLNHYLLSGENHAGSNSLSYGTNAMEMLINALMRLGARRENLQAKLFGGASLIASGRDIGAQNGEFGKRFLERERITLLSASLGGTQARKIRMNATTGHVQQMFVQEQVPVVVQKPMAKRAPADDLELF